MFRISDVDLTSRTQPQNTQNTRVGNAFAVAYLRMLKVGSLRMGSLKLWLLEDETLVLKRVRCPTQGLIKALMNQNNAPQRCLPKWASQVVLVVKNSPANAGDARDAGWIPGSGTQRIRAWQSTSSILAWRISWTEEPGRLQSMGSQRVGLD